MTEAEWLKCTDPDPLIQYLERARKETCRKLRLFGAACFRRIWSLLSDERIRRIVEVAEDYADGRTSAAQLRAASRKADALCKELEITPDSPRIACILANAAIAASWVSASDARFLTNDRMNRIVPGGYYAAEVGYMAGATADAAFCATYEGADAMELVGRRNIEGVSTPADAIWAAEEEAQSRLLRCIFGNPFRPPPSIVPAWLSWQGGGVPKLAAAIYEERRLPSGHLDPARLRILADALEEAGCSDTELLEHLRGPGPHVRGCFAVDLVLGKD